MQNTRGLKTILFAALLIAVSSCVNKKNNFSGMRNGKPTYKVDIAVPVLAPGIFGPGDDAASLNAKKAKQLKLTSKHICPNGFTEIGRSNASEDIVRSQYPVAGITIFQNQKYSNNTVTITCDDE